MQVNFENDKAHLRNIIASRCVCIPIIRSHWFERRFSECRYEYRYKDRYNTRTYIYVCVCVCKYRYRVCCRRIRQVLRYHCVTVCIYDMDFLFPVDVDVRTCMQMYYTYDVRTISMHYTLLQTQVQRLHIHIQLCVYMDTNPYYTIYTLWIFVVFIRGYLLCLCVDIQRCIHEPLILCMHVRCILIFCVCTWVFM